MPLLQEIGIALLAVGVVALIVWFTQSSKAGKIKSVPFKKPSEIAQLGMGAADAKQMVSTEGQMSGQPIAAPMSGQSCAYYEIQVTRGFHKDSRNAQGQTTKTHSTKTLLEQKQGSVFMLGDGAGSVGVDCSKAPSTELKQSHRNRVNVGLVAPGEVQFGNLRLQTESLAANLAGLLVGGETTDYYEGTERIVPFVQGQTLYALGKLGQTSGGLAIGEAGWSALLLSDKGREATLGSAAKLAKIAVIAGAVLMVSGGVCTTLGFVMASHGSATTTTTGAKTPASPPPADHKKK